ncbi:3-ketosphinganine reductase [Lepidopterella palustris CBS 459.81]|uniref:3-dehydrosphinganine reductase n=1 Tax=Lepidopterella palustris CBS 459.81 TaxID=1314670 RepID=A0A8E2E4L8_9PEZI|nr:3-ketosphinganine reductase [Lepidopterella palustris CBS 459.81]
MGLFSQKKHFVLSGRTILITGASQGMGRGLAKICAQKGANVIIVARNIDKLKAAVEYISAAAANPQTQRFHYISADVTSAEENTRLLSEATTWNGGNPPDIVWANAGSAYPHLFIETSIETLRSQMDIDYWAAAYLAHATLQVWTKPTSNQANGTTSKASKGTEPLPRHFVMTSSVVVFAGLAGYGPYGPAKAAMRNLSDTLRSELALYNGARLHATDPLRIPKIRNHIVFPGGIQSPGLDAENKIKHPVTTKLEEDDKPQTEDEVATAAIAGLERGEYLITTAFLGSLMKAGMLGGSPRNGLGVVDTIMTGLSALIWSFVGPDMERKVWKWGKENGIGNT